MYQLELDANLLSPIIIFALLIAIFSLGRLIMAWLDSRALRQEELNGMRWRRMR